jgi:Predicted flavoproteins
VQRPSLGARSGAIRDRVFSSYPSAHAALLPAGGATSFFERDLNIPLVLEEETGKLFPVSNRARDVRDGLVNQAKRQGALVSFGSRLASLEGVPAGWRLETAGNGPLTARSVVLATGGLSVPNTGSDGVGLDLARALGHTVVNPYPALTPLTGSSAFHQELAGVSLHSSFPLRRTVSIRLAGFSLLIAVTVVPLSSTFPTWQRERDSGESHSLDSR